MTNFEKWKDEMLKITHDGYKVAVKDGAPKPCVGICNQCEFEGERPCIAKFVGWLLSEYEEPAPKLTRREKEFLECFTYPTHKEIYRKDYGLFIVAGDPENGFSISNDMFPFINSGETWTFTDLLKLEVEE